MKGFLYKHSTIIGWGVFCIIFFIGSFIYFVVPGWINSPMKNKSIVDFSIEHIKTNEKQIESILNEVKNSYKYKTIHISINTDGSEDVESELFDTISSQEEPNYLNIYGPCRTLGVSYLYINNKNGYVSFYVDKLNHSMHNKDIRLLFFLSKEDKKDYMVENQYLLLDTATNEWKPLDWFFEINDNWLVKSESTDNPMDFLLRPNR